MKQIFKNYLATFVKHWLQTIGTILFILMMFAVVIGFLADPLQIYSKITEMNRVNNKYNQQLETNNIRFSTKFLNDFVINEVDKDGTTPIYKQRLTTNGVETGEGQEIVRIDGLNTDNKQILSPVVQTLLNNVKNDDDSVTSKASSVSSAINDFRYGALNTIPFGVTITDKDDDLTLKYENSINGAVADIVFASDQKLTNISQITTADSNVESRVMSLIFRILTANNFTIPSSDTDIQKIEDSFKQSKSVGKIVVDLIRNQMANNKPEPLKSKTIRLLAIQLFNSEPMVVNNESYDNGNLFYGSNMLAKLLDEENYSYSFDNYIVHQAFYDSNNVNAVSNNELNFADKLSLEHSMYFNRQDSSSFFPTVSLVMKSVNSGSEYNQLQLESGRMPEAITPDVLKKKLSDKKFVPEIVINSLYAKNNNLKIGDYLTFPASNEAKSVLAKNSTDALLTQELTYKIVGIGEKFEDSIPGEHYTHFMEDIKNYGMTYVDKGWFDLLKQAKWFNATDGSSDFRSVYRIGYGEYQNTDPQFVLNANYGDKLAVNGVMGNNAFKEYHETKTMISLNNTKIRVIVFIILGVVVLILAFTFINFTITKELNESRKQIGIFKSFGYKISEVSWVFATKTFITIFVGAVLGWVVSIAVQVWSATAYEASTMFAFDSIYANGVFLTVIFLVIPLVFLLASYFLTLKYLAEPTLSLLSNGRKVKKQKKTHSLLLKALTKHGRGFGYRLQQGFVKDSMGKFIVVQVLFAFASLTFTMMLGAQDLMYSVVNQGFSLMKDDADHQYWWTNQSGFNISGNEQKYNLNKPSDGQTYNDFKYQTYSDKDTIGETLDKSESTSDSRYRENFLVGSISNTFDISKVQAKELLMPLDWYLVRDAGVSPKDLPDKVKDIVKNESPDVQKMYLDAAEADKASLYDETKGVANALAKQKMAYHDYYLNWILTFKIGSMPTTAKEAKKHNDKLLSVSKIIENLKKNPTQYTLDTLNEYVNNWGPASETNKPIKVNLSDLISNPDTALEEFNQTLFGLKDKNEKFEDGKTIWQNNNLFLSDVTKIITLELAENYGENIYNSELSKNANNSGVYSQAAVVKSLDVAKSDPIWKDFSPNNSKYWGMKDNPLMDSIIKPKQMNTVSLAKDNSNKPAAKGGLSLSSMSQQTVSLIMAASMLGYKSNDLNNTPVITLNQAFINRDKEALFENISIEDVDDTQSGNSWMTLFDYKNESFGKYETCLNHEGVSDATYRHLADDDKADQKVNAIYAVVPYGLAKYRHLKVGDLFTVSTSTKVKKPITVRIIGINKSATYAISGGWQIDVDYTQFVNHYFDQDAVKTISLDKNPLFDSWISNEPMLEGDINLNDIPGSVDSMKFVGKNLAIQMKPGTSIFGSIFGGIVDITALLPIKTDSGFRIITNPNIATSSYVTNTWPFNILRAGVNDGVNLANNILIVFIVLVAVMLMIILVVVMNIVIEEATPIILTLKSLGYNRFEINWITMGSYIVGAAISFVIAYCISLIVWNVFLVIAANLWHIYVFMHYTWKVPIVTLLVIGAILSIGWYVSNQKVQKMPLTLVTGFN